MRLFNKCFLVLFLAAAFPVMTFAQTSAALKIGVVDINRLMSESPQFQAARAKLDDEFAPRRREIIAMQTSLEERAAELQKDLEVMGETERETAQRELRNEERSIVRAQNEFREDTELRNNEVLRVVQQDVIGEVVAYSESEGFDLMLVEGIVFASDKVNVTQAVLELLLAKDKAARQ
ncbi:MAG: OmpH family outer membrane protein [Gammaproteobacteria bacterium]|nr:OmpH family outer membrane protein [Gammaproteobacteria bacterium]MCP4832083.1 OmpH family outer membrane protein [Gammaproteobacteria bacterium]